MRVRPFSNNALGTKLDFVVPHVHNDSLKSAPPPVQVVKQDFSQEGHFLPEQEAQFAIDRSGPAPILRVTGDWTIHTIGLIDAELRPVRDLVEDRPAIVDVSGLMDLDTAGPHIESTLSHIILPCSLQAPPPLQLEIAAIKIVAKNKAVLSIATGTPLHSFSVLPPFPMRVLVVKVYHWVEQLNPGGGGITPTLHPLQPAACPFQWDGKHL